MYKNITLDKLWQYPYGVSIIVKGEEYIFIQRDMEIGYAFYYKGLIIWDEELFDDRELNEIEVKLHYPDDVAERALEGLKCYYMTLLEEPFMHENTLKFLLKQIKWLEELVNANFEGV